MEDVQIVDLYWARNENAIAESDRKYGRMLRSVSFSLLSNREDAEECVNDTYLDAWGAMPTERPTFLGAFLSRITRRISIDRYRREHRQKRGGVNTLEEELTECVPDRGEDLFRQYESGRLQKSLDRFLAGLPQEKRVLFVRRYFFSQSVSELAERMGMSESNVKTTLYRIREALRRQLEEEDLL